MAWYPSPAERCLPQGRLFGRCFHSGAEIENEAFVFPLARFLVRLSKQRGWVKCSQNFWRKPRRQHFAALARDAERWPEDRLCGGCAETNQQLRFHQTQLRFEPRPASSDFARVWFLVDATLTLRFPFKVLYRIRHVNMATIDSRFFECAIHDLSRRSDERFAGEILVISRLFSNQHHWRGFRSFAKDSLRGALVKMACRAIPRSFTDCAQTRCRRRRCRPGIFFLNCWHVPDSKSNLAHCLCLVSNGYS
jgi:hypothetical protein